ncbi:hypothetical protein ACFPRL_14000 [Pseudoclavibacter helvolus]
MQAIPKCGSHPETKGRTGGRGSTDRPTDRSPDRPLDRSTARRLDGSTARRRPPTARLEPAVGGRCVTSYGRQSLGFEPMARRKAALNALVVA